MKGRVLVLPIENEEKSASGLFIGTNAYDKTQKGTVIAVNEDEYNIFAGDTVIFQKGYGIELSVDGVSHLILNESDILAVY